MLGVSAAKPGGPAQESMNASAKNFFIFLIIIIFFPSGQRRKACDCCMKESRFDGVLAW